MQNPQTAMSDPLGLRRIPSTGNKAVPLVLNPSAERKKPWWIEDRHEASKAREDVEREAHQARLRATAAEGRDARDPRDRENVSSCIICYFFPLSSLHYWSQGPFMRLS